MFKTVVATLLFFLLFTVAATAQDVLHKTNGYTDTVIVIEITQLKIIYKKPNQTHNKPLSIDKEDVIYIEYADGNVDVIENPDDEDDEYEYEDDEPWPNNFQNSVSLNWLGIMMGDINLGYEFITPKRNFSLRINANYHFKDINAVDWFIDDRVYAIRADFNFFTGYNKNVRYFLGPSIRVAKLERFDNRLPSSLQTSNRQQFRSIAVMLINGFQIETSTPLFLSVMAGIGAGSGINLDDHSKYGNTEGVGAFNIGYRF
jgi:hypothetical protein